MNHDEHAQSLITPLAARFIRQDRSERLARIALDFLS